MEKNLQIRNSTVEFLTFVLDGKEDGVQVLYKDDTIWATQKAMSILFDCSTDNVGLHLKNIFNSNELDVNSTTEKISVVQTEGDREVNRYYPDMNPESMTKNFRVHVSYTAC